MFCRYNSQLKDACIRSDKMTSTHKQLADNYIKLSACLLDIANLENSKLESFSTKLSDTFEKMRRIESRVANDQDLKLSDTLRYHMRDTSAAKDLLYRRLRFQYPSTLLMFRTSSRGSLSRYVMFCAGVLLTTRRQTKIWT